MYRLFCNPRINTAFIQYYKYPSRYKNSLMKSVNKSTKKNWVQKPRFVYKGTNRPLINNLSGSGLLKKAIFPSSLAFFRRGHCFFLLLLIFFRKIRVDLGRFPFSQNFRKFRLDRKWKTIGRFVPLENSRKKWKI